jgi:hypothetical protein
MHLTCNTASLPAVQKVLSLASRVLAKLEGGAVLDADDAALEVGQRRADRALPAPARVTVLSFT